MDAGGRATHGAVAERNPGYDNGGSVIEKHVIILPGKNPRLKNIGNR
jgi:hypothetical protein